ncbi:SET domain [Cinara cedri]|uniref:SET domain n=1 Tax=Cinara cedri TaxID=506608 RepID=A0A5E4NQB3_9HEMI|nr:SET domain [Cinara cedri]
MNDDEIVEALWSSDKFSEFDDGDVDPDFALLVQILSSRLLILLNTSLLNALALFTTVTGHKMSVTEFRENIVQALITKANISMILKPNEGEIHKLINSNRGRCSNCYFEMVQQGGRNHVQKVTQPENRSQQSTSCTEKRKKSEENIKATTSTAVTPDPMHTNRFKIQKVTSDHEIEGNFYENTNKFEHNMNSTISDNKKSNDNIDNEENNSAQSDSDEEILKFKDTAYLIMPTVTINYNDVLYNFIIHDERVKKFMLNGEMMDLDIGKAYDPKEIDEIVDHIIIFDSCSNRVIQLGSAVRISIYKTKTCGWGIKASQDIAKGNFIAIYSGEIITRKESYKRLCENTSSADFMWNLDFDDPIDYEYVIDASNYSNFTRFINHSCDANLNVHTVWVDCLNRNLHQLALFTSRYISAGEQLTFDYFSRHGGTLETTDIRCQCNIKNCRGYYF